MAEANSANPTPQHPGPAEPAGAAAGGRKLTAVREGQEGGRAAPKPAPGQEQPRRRGVSKGVFALVVVLLVLSLIGLFAQTQRVAAQDEQIALLSSQVEGLQFQLSAANTQIATYDMQRTLVRTSVADLLEQMTALSELVNDDPLAPGTPAGPEAE